MIAQVVTEKLAEVRAACERHRVRNLWLFGSATTPEFDPSRSDLDFLVEFEPGVKRGFDGDYFGLMGALGAIFAGRRVEVVEVGASENPYFLAEVERQKRPLYAAA